MRSSIVLVLLATTLFAPRCFAQEAASDDAKKVDAKPTKVSLERAGLLLQAPAEWKAVEPKFKGIIDYEFQFPAEAKDDEPVIRITVSAAGGSLDQNIERWKSQLTDMDEKKSTTSKFEAAKHTVHLVDLTGSYLDRMGAPPMARIQPTVRENYRVLGAIIETEKAGLQFIKAIGPADLVEKIAEPMKAMLKEMKSE